MIKKIGIKVGIISAIIIIPIIIFGFKNNDNAKAEKNEIISGENSVKLEENNELVNYNIEDKSNLSTIETIKLIDLDGNGTNFSFIYNDKNYKAIYSKDNWRIVNSFEITNGADMAIICHALIDIHPIHGKDMISYRTVEDLVYEWELHNIAYHILPEDSPWRINAKDVDFDPADQGRNLAEMYKERIER